MDLQITKTSLLNLLSRQLSNLLCFELDELAFLEFCVDQALLDCEYCFSRTQNKYYECNGRTYFNPFHSGQYTIFLYFASRRAFLNQGTELCEQFKSKGLADRIYYLNRILNSVDLFYEVELPRFFCLDHPIGAVIGRARSIGEGFTFSQGCTVGNNKGTYPVIGKNVQMFSNSKLVGDSVVGDNVLISANTYIKDTSIPANSVVFGGPRDLVIKPANVLK